MVMKIKCPRRTRCEVAKWYDESGLGTVFNREATVYLTKNILFLILKTSDPYFTIPHIIHIWHDIITCRTKYDEVR